MIRQLTLRNRAKRSCQWATGNEIIDLGDDHVKETSANSDTGASKSDETVTTACATTKL